MKKIIMTLWACSRPPWVVLFNNTPQTIISDYGQKSFQIEPYTSKEVNHPTEHKKRTIKMGPLTYVYDTKPTVYDYVEWGLPKDRLNFQLEANGYIYVLKPGTPFPTLNLSAQPPGYPLIPVKN